MKLRILVLSALLGGGLSAAVATAPAAVAAAKPCSAVGTAVNAKGKPVGNSGKENGKKLFKGRASARSEDQERVGGATTNVSGYTTTVLSSEIVPEVDQFQNDGYLKVTVRICSRDSDPQHWDMSEFKLQTPSGNTVSPDLVVSVPTLDYAGGELTQGGQVEGDIYFKVGNPAAPGSYYVLYEPDFLNRTRGVWQINL